MTDFPPERQVHDDSFRYRCLFCGKRFGAVRDMALHEQYLCAARETMLKIWQRRREQHQAEQS